MRLVGHVEGYSGGGGGGGGGGCCGGGGGGGGGSLSSFRKVLEVSFRSTPGCCRTEAAHHNLMYMILFTLL